MFENHRQLIEAVQQDSILPELQNQPGELLTEGKSLSFGGMLEQATAKFAKTVVKAIEKVAGGHAEKVQWLLSKDSRGPGHFAVEYRGEDRSDMELYVLIQVGIGDDGKGMVSMYGKGSMMASPRRVIKKGESNNLTAEYVATLFEKNYLG